MSARTSDLIDAVEGTKAAIELISKDQKKDIEQLKAEVADLKDRVEEREAKGKSPGRTETDAPASRQAREHLDRFTKWVRRPHDGGAQQALAQIQSDIEHKDVTVGSGPGGGFAVPEQISREVDRLERLYSPVRDLVNVVPVSTGNYKELITIGGATSGWVGEAGPRSETDTPLLREIAPTMGEIYAYPQTTEWALDDAFFNVGTWLTEEVARELSFQLGDAVIRGNGSNKPTGMLNTSPVSTADDASPLRAAAAYQYIESDSDAGLAGSPAIPGILADSLIDLVYSVNSAYRTNGTFVMNSKTAGSIMKLRDAESRFIWTQSLTAGQPSLLLGYPVRIWEQMDDIGADKFPVGFGDFRRGYTLTQRTELRITVDANITTPGRIKYFVRQRLGGIPKVNDAVKFLKTVS